MMKTIDDYMNDPSIIDEPLALREIHAIRLKTHDETKGMSTSEFTAFIHEQASEFLSVTPLNLTQSPNVNCGTGVA